MKKEMIMGIVGLAMVLLSVPTQMLILALYPSVGSVVLCIAIGLIVGALGANLVSLTYDFWEWLTIRGNKSAKGLHGRRRAGRV